MRFLVGERERVIGLYMPPARASGKAQGCNVVSAERACDKAQDCTAVSVQYALGQAQDRTTVSVQYA
jgi:hypothetical protein